MRLEPLLTLVLLTLITVLVLTYTISYRAYKTSYRARTSYFNGVNDLQRRTSLNWKIIEGWLIPGYLAFIAGAGIWAFIYHTQQPRAKGKEYRFVFVQQLDKNELAQKIRSSNWEDFQKKVLDKIKVFEAHKCEIPDEEAISDVKKLVEKDVQKFLYYEQVSPPESSRLRYEPALRYQKFAKDILTQLVVNRTAQLNLRRSTFNELYTCYADRKDACSPFDEVAFHKLSETLRRELSHDSTVRNDTSVPLEEAVNKLNKLMVETIVVFDSSVKNQTALHLQTLKVKADHERKVVHHEQKKAFEVLLKAYRTAHNSMRSVQLAAVRNLQDAIFIAASGRKPNCNYTVRPEVLADITTKISALQNHLNAESREVDEEISRLKKYLLKVEKHAEFATLQMEYALSETWRLGPKTPGGTLNIKLTSSSHASNSSEGVTRMSLEGEAYKQVLSGRPPVKPDLRKVLEEDVL